MKTDMFTDIYEDPNVSFYCYEIVGRNIVAPLFFLLGN